MNNRREVAILGLECKGPKLEIFRRPHKPWLHVVCGHLKLWMQAHTRCVCMYYVVTILREGCLFVYLHHNFRMSPNHQSSRGRYSCKTWNNFVPNVMLCPSLSNAHRLDNIGSLLISPHLLQTLSPAYSNFVSSNMTFLKGCTRILSNDCQWWTIARGRRAQSPEGGSEGKKELATEGIAQAGSCVPVYRSGRFSQEKPDQCSSFTSWRELLE